MREAVTYFVFCAIVLLTTFQELLSEEIVELMPPKGWQLVKSEQLPPCVRFMVVGPALVNELPPSINLSSEPFNGSLKEYLKIVKSINQSQRVVWEDLGSMSTKGVGPVSLSQIERPTQWGALKLLQAIFIHDEHVVIATAAALKKEFPKWQKIFINCLQSLQFRHSDASVLTKKDKDTPLLYKENQL